MKINNGGPAFPQHVVTQTPHGYVDERGLTKRELFAAKALEGYLASGRHIGGGSLTQFTPDNLAKDCIRCADALLAALTQGCE